MGRIVIDVASDFPRPPSVVFKFIVDGYFENLGKWNPVLLENVKLTEGPVRVDTRGREAQLIMKERREREYEVVTFERDRRFEVRKIGTDKLEKHYFGSYGFTAIPGGTRLEQRFELEWDQPFFRFLPFVVKRLIKKDLAASHDRMRAALAAEAR